MGMVVRTNTMALNAYRQLGLNNSAVAKSLEKLASGYRINRAGDDAAGLAISEKMKAQITGLETASSNAQDGISLIQTAEGNLGEVHDMLNRMVELATKSANGTYTSQERDALQAEVSQLLDEIDRISQSANFNGAKLLDGTMGLNNEAFQIGKSTGYVAAGDKAMEVNALHASASGAEIKPSFTVDFKDFEYKVADEKGDNTEENVKVNLSIGGQNIKIWNGTDDFTADILGTVATNDKDGSTMTGVNLATALKTAKTVSIDGYAYKVEAGATTTDVKLTFVGKADTAGTDGVSATDTKVPANPWTPSGDVSVTATAVGGTGTGTGRIDCPVYDIKDAQAGADPVRAGAKVTLTADMIKTDNTLTIGNTVFTFKDGTTENTTANNGAAANIFVDRSLSEADQLKSVTRQLSFMTAKIDDAAGTERTFNIGRSDASGYAGIEIEENETATANLGKFTEAQLKNAFQIGTKETMANVTFKIVDNDKMADTETITVDGKKIEFARGKDTADTFSKLQSALGTGYEYAVNGDTITISAKAAPTATAADKAAMAAPVITGSGLTLQIGDTADEYNKMTIGVPNMSSAGLGLEGLTVANQTAASNAIDTIKSAINQVSTVRANMGALQNRLEHTINNLDVAAENLSAANSRIRDTDMAKEMMNYTKMNVLVQSAQAMLAQANQQPQSVLQLLQ